MRERPVLFSAPMVRAILNGTKTQTRRVVKLPHMNPLGEWEASTIGGQGVTDSHGTAVSERVCIWHTRTADVLSCPYGLPGDRLWVRETTHSRPMLNILTGEPLGQKYNGGAYTADGEDVLTPEGFDIAWWYSRKSCPSIHMPRWASRIDLEVTGVRVERLNAISEADCWAEGIEEVMNDFIDETQYATAKRLGASIEDAKPLYCQLWESINGPESWDANPFVWVVEFKRINQGADNDETK